MAKKRIGENPLDSLIPKQPASETENQEAGKTEKKNDGKPEKQDEGKTGKQYTGKTVKQPDSLPESEAEKVKATYYLPADVEADLEYAWLRLRRITGRKVSKSDIVAEALRALAEDVKEHGADSRYAKQLKT